jgi:hypothetical protein
MKINWEFGRLNAVTAVWVGKCEVFGSVRNTYPHSACVWVAGGDPVDHRETPGEGSFFRSIGWVESILSEMEASQ